MASRNLTHLDAAFRRKVDLFLATCRGLGIDLIVTCTYRSADEQAALYAKGRTTEGKIVTWAKPGESYHNRTVRDFPAALAVDVVPVRSGKAIWDATDPVWQTVGEIGERCGLEWAGRWSKGKREYPHFQEKEDAQA